MRPAVYALYTCALALLLTGLRELLFGFEENRCSMTYMFEHPEYRRIQLPRRVACQYPAYGLYLYGEGSYAQETRGLKLTGAPVLFLPGNAGSHKQGKTNMQIGGPSFGTVCPGSGSRSLGSVALRKAENVEGGIHLNVFTIDFNEELVALYGGSLLRQTHFLHESIKVILRLYKNRPDPPSSVVLVGHSMGGVVARALFTLPRFNPHLVSLILTQASPHHAPVVSLDPYILGFYSSVKRRWSSGAEDLRNVTVLSVGGGYRDYQVRSGLAALSCPVDDLNKLSVVVTAVPRTWVSTDHLSIVWCKELVLATVRAFFDLIEPETQQDHHRAGSMWVEDHSQHCSDPDVVVGMIRLCGGPVGVLWGSCPLKNRVIQYTEKQMDYSLDLYTYRVSCRVGGADGFTDDVGRRMSVLSYHFIRHPVQLPGDPPNTPVSFAGPSEAWTEVNTLRVFYSAPKEASVKYFLFALSSRRKAYTHFYCRSSNMEMSSWLFGCTQMNGPVCVQAVDLSWGTELLPAYKVLTVKLDELSSVSHLVIDASNPSARQFIVECEWQRERSQTAPVPVPHVLSFGEASSPTFTFITSRVVCCSVPCLTSSDVTINSSGLLHTLQLHHFHQVYQAFRISVMSHCKTTKERLPSVYRMKVPWFREDSFFTASIPSVTEISGMLHTARHDNTSSALLELHTAPNCQYKVISNLRSVCAIPPLHPYSASPALTAKHTALRSTPVNPPLHPYSASPALTAKHTALRSTPVNPPLHPYSASPAKHTALRSTPVNPPLHPYSASVLHDTLPLTPMEDLSQHAAGPGPEWPRLVSLLLCVLGAAVAFWGTTVLGVSLRMMSFVLAPLHRPSVSRHCGTFQLPARILLILSLTALGGVTCGALSITASFLLHLYRVLRLQMTERSLSHMLNLAPQRTSQNTENGFGTAEGQSKLKECNGSSLLSESVLQDVRDDLQLHLSLSTLLTLPMMLSAPSLIYWSRNLRYSVHLDPDPWWPHTVPLLISSVLLINCNTQSLSLSKLMLPLTSRLLLPLCIAMVTFSPLHLYRVTHFLSAAVTLLAASCHL
ncbi:hypothetical protein NFI96_020741 [Prochilodus magdalenae]|nr:hypothetical protein NFI96_020741 [Prochilodus magdalenae]